MIFLAGFLSGLGFVLVSLLLGLLVSAMIARR